MKYRDMLKNNKRISKPEDVDYKIGDWVKICTKGRGTIYMVCCCGTWCFWLSKDKAWESCIWKNRLRKCLAHMMKDRGRYSRRYDDY